MSGAVLQAMKAEVVFAVQVVSRHRAPRAALALVGAVTLLMASTGVPPEARRATLWMAAGVLGCLGGSRLLAPGAALAAAAQVPLRAWQPALGRLLGLGLLLAPAVAVAAVGVVRPGAGADGFGGSVAGAVSYGTVTGAMVMAAAPLVGASAAALLGLLVSTVGQIPPGTVGALGEGTPWLGGVVSWVWRWGPLPWRAHHEPVAAAVVVHGAWVAVGVAMAALVVGGRRREGWPDR